MSDVESTKLAVWVDNDNCCGGGLCVEAVPEVFAHKDGLCHIKDGKALRNGPDTPVEVPAALKDKVMEAAENCPGECIFIEIA
jgi:ferredoxin